MLPFKKLCQEWIDERLAYKISLEANKSAPDFFSSKWYRCIMKLQLRFDPICKLELLKSCFCDCFFGLANEFSFSPLYTEYLIYSFVKAVIYPHS